MDYYFFSKKNVRDSSAAITEKNVVLCRSGMQIYRRFEIEGRGDLDMKGHDEEEFLEYRPPDVVVAAKDLMKNLPVTKEHPSSFVCPENWSSLAHGTTGSDIDVISLGEGEIGIESSIIFNTNDIYDYYVKGNKEVSLGYSCEKRWATEEEKEKYHCDIILTKITEVNHLAVTACGRGGSKVAILDSLLSGVKRMKSGLFFCLDRKHETKDSSKSFADTVYEALESCEGRDDKAVTDAFTKVMDSFSAAKDSPQKTKLMDVIEDCFTDIPKALKYKEEIYPLVNDAWVTITGESVADIRCALGITGETSDACHKTGDTDGRGKNTGEVADAEEDKKDEKMAEGKDEKSEEGKDEKKQVSDSELNAAVKAAVKEALQGMDSLVEEKVKKVLQIDSSGAQPFGGAVNSETTDVTNNLVTDLMLQ